MPFLDGTGPLGLGPMTGRGLGPCRWIYGRYYGYGYAPWWNVFMPWRWGWGGLGLGWRWRWRGGWGWRRGWGWWW